MKLFPLRWWGAPRLLAPLVYAGVAVTFALVAALACLLPSLRASQLDFAFHRP